MLIILYFLVSFNIELFAGDKPDMLLPTNQGLPAPGVMPYPHGDVSFIHRQHARER